MKTPLSIADLTQLIKYMGMLGSDHDGEIAAAGRHATKFLKARGLTWAEVFKLPDPAAPTVIVTKVDGLDNHAELALWILGDPFFVASMSDWEVEFVTSISRRHFALTEKQEFHLKKIAARFMFVQQGSRYTWSTV